MIKDFPASAKLFKSLPPPQTIKDTLWSFWPLAGPRFVCTVHTCTHMRVTQYTVLPMFSQYSADLRMVETRQEMQPRAKKDREESRKLVNTGCKHCRFRNVEEKNPALLMFYEEAKAFNAPVRPKGFTNPEGDTECKHNCCLCSREEKNSSGHLLRKLKYRQSQQFLAS